MDTRAPETWVCRLCGDTAPPGHVAGVRCGRDGAVFVRLADLTTHPEDPLLGQVVGGKFAVVGSIRHITITATFKLFLADA